MGVAALAIEVGQIALPDKTSDLTEVTIRSLGGYAGLLITVYANGKRHCRQDGESRESSRMKEPCETSGGDPAVETVRSERRQTGCTID